MVSRRRSTGFTLIETLIVLIISLGLVGLMAGLYRAVGNSALALRSGGQEWSMQRQLREQLGSLFAVPKSSVSSVEGEPAEIYLTSWRSVANGLDGKPVLARVRYDAGERTLTYQETELPAWWAGAAARYDSAQLHAQVREAPMRKLATGLEQLEFLYLPSDATDLQPGRWLATWHNEASPKMIQLNFSKAGRRFAIWLEVRANDA